MKRLTESSITDLAMRLAEKADDIKYCVIIYELKERDEEQFSMGTLSDDQVTIAQANWLLDAVKNFWLNGE